MEPYFIYSFGTHLGVGLGIPFGILLQLLLNLVLKFPFSSLRVPIVTLHGVLLGTPLVDIIEASFKIGLGSSFRAAL